jgi:hypothetical protein
MKTLNGTRKHFVEVDLSANFHSPTVHRTGVRRAGGAQAWERLVYTVYVASLHVCSTTPIQCMRNRVMVVTQRLARLCMSTKHKKPAAIP